MTTFAEVITGWSIGGEQGRRPQGEPGKFTFRAETARARSEDRLGQTLPGYRL